MEFWLKIWSFRCDWSDSLRTSVNNNNSTDKFLNVKCSPLSFLESGLHYFELSKLSVHIKKHINNSHSTCVSCQSVLSRLVIEISWFPPPHVLSFRHLPNTGKMLRRIFFLSLRLSFSPFYVLTSPFFICWISLFFISWSWIISQVSPILSSFLFSSFTFFLCSF